MLSKILNKTFLKFLMVGVINTLIGDGLMFILFNCFHTSYWISSAANYVVGGISSFLLNKFFTFRDSKKSLSQIILFIANMVICYFIAFKLSKLIFTYLIQLESQNISDNLSLLLGTIFYTFLNYFGQKIFVFSNSSNSK